MKVKIDEATNENAGRTPLELAFVRLFEAVENKEKLASLEKSVDEAKIDGEKLLKEFMALAEEPLTWVEGRELWNDMRKTNISKLPKLRDSLHESFHSVKYDLASTWKDKDDICDLHDKNAINYSDEELVDIARQLKSTYSIRLSDDKSELKFVLCALGFLWSAACTVFLIGQFAPDATNLGELTWGVFLEAFCLFFIELIWECVLSWIVLRYNIKINYTRKLGNLFKIPKYFLADFLPFYKSTALSMTTSIAINQTLFCAMYYRKTRERFPFCSYVFLSQDRREDRPDTLTFQVTEDIMRFIVYIPFKLLVANRVGFPAIIFIPIAINNIGDGLAEPVGVKFGKHKYTTTALYYKGKFWHGEFTRSYEGSSCVFLTSIAVVAANHNAFPSELRFWITIALLPLLMTIAEAKAPHTNDGPFLALIGCGFLTAIFLA